MSRWVRVGGGVSVWMWQYDDHGWVCAASGGV